MSTSLPPVAENPDQFGRFTIVTRDMDDNGQITSVHRAPQEPGNWADGIWVPTDVASLPASVQPFALGLWTEATIDRFKAAFPWAPPPPPPQPTPAVVHIETLWRRATDQEAEDIEAAVASLNVRLRNMFSAATSLTTGDELTEELRAAMALALTVERADALLAAD